VGANSQNRLDAIVSFCGIPPAQVDLSNVKAPVQAHFAELDQRPSPMEVEHLEAQLKASGVPYEVYRYSSKGQTFMNLRPEGPAKDRELAPAWSRVVGFLSRTLDIAAV